MANEERYDAMVEFIGCFPTISGALPTNIYHLSDGVVLFEALSDIAPDQFDPTTISRDNTNWALKATNLRKLLRNVESYVQGTLSKTTDFQSLSDLISTIARADENDPSEEVAEGIAQFVELLVATAVTCEDKGRYIGWIMGMEGQNQVMMKGIIESSLAMLEDFDEGELLDTSRNSKHSYPVGSPMGSDLSDDDFDGGAELTGLFRNAMQNLDSATEGLDVTIGSHSEYSGGQSQTDMNGNASADIVRQRDEMRVALAEAKRELAAQKKNNETLVEDGETTQKKLRALAADLQERLERRQEELLETEEKLMQCQRGLEDAEAKVSDLEDKNVTLEDELDIAKAKALQLKKAEATVVAYRKKLEGAGVMNQQMNELENQSAKYLGQIVDLEMEAKKIPELQKNLDIATRELTRTQKEKKDIEEKVLSKTTVIAKLKTELSASVAAKKVAEEEVQELRAIQEAGETDLDDGPNIGGLSLDSAQTMSEVKEKVMRLEIENKTLKKELETTKETPASESPAAVAAPVDDTTVSALESEIAQLQAQLKKKDAATAKLTADKDKLEAYTKRTLSKFQEKYLVALQECKAKLKEKHDKIEALEMRSAAEKSNQKKEEKLLSSTIYELGLTIMQQKLKSR